jgi:hypothetical protein
MLPLFAHSNLLFCPTPNFTFIVDYYRSNAWCYDCNRITDAEDLPDVETIREKYGHCGLGHPVLAANQGVDHQDGGQNSPPARASITMFDVCMCPSME